MRKGFFLSIILFLLILCVGCNNEKEPAIPSDRTVLIYMSAENSISNYSHQNLKSILEGAKNNNLNGGNLLVYIDSRQTTPYLYKIKQNSNGTTETEVIEQYEEQNSADHTVMSSVINTVLRKYPSASYGLFLWSHGTAWLPGDLSDYTTRAFGEDSGKHMEINTLKETLPSGIFDFIIFDACYMASVEVTYALKEKADYILASPTEVLGNGMPYEEIIQPLFATNLSVSEMLEKIGRLFFTFYKEQKKGNYYPISASISLVDTHALDALATACKTILSGEFETMYELPKKNIQSLDYLEYNTRMLYDMSDIMSHCFSDKQETDYRNAFDKTVLYKQTTEKAYYSLGNGTELPIDVDRFCGLSMYLPQSDLPKLNDWYKDLDWYKAVYE